MSVELQAHRQWRLQDAINQLCDGNETEFGRRIGFKDGAFVRQMLAGRRSITEKTVLKVEALPGLKGWFASEKLPSTTHPTKGGSPVASRGRTMAGSLIGSIAVAILDAEESVGMAGTQAGQQATVTNMVINEQWLRRMAEFDRPEDLALMTARGDSMATTFEDGDVLLVNRGVADVSDGGVYVLQLEAERFVRRVQLQFDGSLLMISDNDKLPPQHVPREARTRFNVLGRVIMAWNARRM